MLYYNAKKDTKDIDLLFENEKDRDEIVETLSKIGFAKSEKFTIFRRYNSHKIPAILMDGPDSRIDLFCNEVISFKLTDGIKNRAREEHKYANLVVKVIAPEDILLLKCATERAKDRDDAASLIKLFNINWNLIVKEAEIQTTIGRKIFLVFLYDFLLELKEMDVEVPAAVLKTLEKISIQLMEEVLGKK